MRERTPAPRRRLRQLSLTIATTVLLVATVGATRAAFSVSASSAGNSFAAGTVTIGDNDVGGTALTLSAASPGTTDTSCLLVSYGGSLPSTVKLHATVTGALAPYVLLTVTRGTDSTPAFDACGGFTADTTNYVGMGAGVVYSGPLNGYPSSYATGLADPPSGAVTWTQGTSRSYRLAVTLTNNTAAQGQSAAATFRWEARNT